MKFLILALFVVAASAQENYDGPEYYPFDAASIIPRTEFPGFWEGRDFPKAFYDTSLNPRAQRIVGGVEVAPNSHPYQVALHMTVGGGTGLCGGSVLTTRSVLTAAHCPVGSSSTLVIAGAHNRNVVEANQQRRTVTSANYRIHASYNANNLNNDIAILITPTPAFTMTGAVQLTRRPTGGQLSETFAGDTGRSTGWGRTTNGGSTSAVLRKAYNPVITNAVCAQTFGTGVVNAAVVCIATAGVNQGTCNGDSGGVLSVQRGTGQWVQIGVTSFVASAGCVAGLPSGFERTTSHNTWINNNMNP
jgi:secreted trypsin-like serine protease